jgi:hypothetical protein
MWSPQPALGGALWSGNQSLATTRQLLSTSAGLAIQGDSNFDFATISTLSVSTITGFNNGTQPIRIQNTSSILISTFRNATIDAASINLNSKTNMLINNNGTLAIDNKDPVTGNRTAANLTNIITGEGSFQALAGNLSLTTSERMNFYSGGDKYQFETYYSQANLPDGIIDMSGNNLLGVRSFSTQTISTGTIASRDIKTTSLSSIFVSTGGLKAGAAVFDSITTGGTTMTGPLNMNNNNITNVATIGATTGNFTSITGNLTGNVSGNLTGNVTGNVTGNIYNTNLTIGGQYSITETVDVGSAISNYASYANLNISAKGGLGSLVNIIADVATPNNPAVTTSQMNLEAKGNYGLITPGTPFGYIPRGGRLNITAREGLTPSPPAEVTSALFANGEIDLTAYSYGTVPGLIKLSAGANFMYAGPVSPFTALIGTNNIYGTVANTIVSGTPPSLVPTFPGTNYLYGLNGTSIQNTLYVDNITNYGNITNGLYSNLSIFITTPPGQPARDVLMSNVKYIYMQNNPTIDGAGTGSINSFSNINGSNLNIYKQGYISSLTVDDIVWNKFSEEFQTLYTSTLYASTITGFNNGNQNIRLFNNSSILISSGANLVQGGSNIILLGLSNIQGASSNISLTGSNLIAITNNTGKTNILASTLNLSASDDATLSANNKDLTVYGGLSTIITAGTSINLTAPQARITSGLSTVLTAATSFYVDTPILQNKIHLDTPSLSTLNFQATNFLATTTTVASQTITGTLTVPIISTTTINNIGAGVPITVNAPSLNTTTVNATTVAATTGNLTTVNATTVNAINMTSLGQLAIQNIKGNPNLSISTGTLNIQTTLNNPVVITTNFSYGAADQYFTVPSGVTSIQISLLGAGGGSNSSSTYSTPGSGGLVSGTLAVTPGTTYTIQVGEGGGTFPAGRQRYGGGGQGFGTTGCDGGGQTRIRTAGGSVVAVAGGGGGAARFSSYGNPGGAGGGLVGGAGGGSDPFNSPPIVSTGGGGGTQSAGGTPSYAPNNDGNPGSLYNGGAGITGAGAGGGGYYGGASGSFNAPSTETYGGGGGGSSYIAQLIGTVVNSQGGGAAPTANGSASISYFQTEVVPTIQIDAFTNITNKLTFNGNSIVTWTQTVSFTQNAFSPYYDSGWVNAVYPPTGETFSSSDYIMTVALQGSALNLGFVFTQVQVAQQVNGSTWQVKGYGTTQSQNPKYQYPTATWTVAITMTPLELCPGGAVHATPPEPSFYDGAIYQPWSYQSTIVASTLTVLGTENIAMLAGVPEPAFVSTGSIYIAGTNNTNLIGNITAVGGFTDVDLDALTGNVNVVATAGDINLSAYNNVNLTGSNGLIYTGASKLWGSNVGNSLGLYRPLRFYYEPPTAAGQSAEINIEAHPADAGVVFSLRYGVDLAAGYGYLLCEWPGYIVVPMKIYGQDIALEGGETVHINANSGNITLHATGSVLVDAPSLNMNANPITFGASGGDIQQINTAFWANGGTAQGYGGSLYLGASNSVYFQVPVGFQNTGTPLDLNGNNINNVSTATSKFLIATGATGYGTQTPISPLALVNGNGAGRSQIEFQYWEGGYKHYITSEHDGGGAAGNSLSFWIYDYSVPGSGGSSTPGTGNTRVMLMGADGVSVGTSLDMNNHDVYGVRTITNGTSQIALDPAGDMVITPPSGYSILQNGPVKSVLSATAVAQPVIQYGEDAGSGTSGNITITIPVAYTSATSYVAFASMMDTGDCKISVNRDSASQITVYWSQAGSGTHPIGWNTMGI